MLDFRARYTRVPFPPESANSTPTCPTAPRRQPSDAEMAVVAVLELSVIAAMLLPSSGPTRASFPSCAPHPKASPVRASGPVAVTMVLLAALFLLALHSRRALTACQRTARDEATRKHEIAWELMAMRNSAMHSDESVRVGRSFKPQPSDVFVVTYPKCGTTWVTQILHALRTAFDGLGRSPRSCPG